MSVIANVSAPVKLVITQVDDHVKMRLISQLVKSIPRASTPFVLPSVGQGGHYS